MNLIIHKYCVKLPSFKFSKIQQKNMTLRESLLDEIEAFIYRNTNEWNFLSFQFDTVYFTFSWITFVIIIALLCVVLKFRKKIMLCSRETDQSFEFSNQNSNWRSKWHHTGDQSIDS